ncbi:hypothetical protein B0H14DRAFT_3130028 [Mycena olivaceomarginata]|nr:hypothetical protein B0H14DRAFT_3130028 [Mycena olivaceomarginata]
MYYVSAMRSDALVHAPSSPVKRIHLVGRRTGQHLGDAPIVHTIAPPALLAEHPVLPHCGSSAQGYSAAQCPSPPLRPACYATRLRHRAPLRGMQGGVSAAIFALAPHLLAPPQKGRTPADANRKSSRSLASLGAAAFASASGWHLFALRTHQQWSHGGRTVRNHRFPAPLLVPSRLRTFIILPPAPQWGKGGCAGTVSTDHSAGQEVHTYEVDLMLETTACGNDNIPMARVPSGCIEVVEQCFVKLPRDSSVIRPYQTSTRRRQQETVWWVKSVARAVDAHNGLKEHWWRSVWRGDRERALDVRMSWWKPRNVTLITSESSASEICAPNLPAILKRQKSSKPLAKPVESQITVRTRRKRCKQLPLGDIRHLRAYTRLLDHKSVARLVKAQRVPKNYSIVPLRLGAFTSVGIGVSGRKQTSAQGRRSSTQAAGIEHEGGGERAAGGGGGGGGREPNGAGERAANGAGTERGGRAANGAGARAANGASERRGGRTANGAGGACSEHEHGGRAANGAEARAASTSAGAGGERRGRAGSEWRQRTARGANGERRRGRTANGAGARAASTSAVAGGRTARGSGAANGAGTERERQAANGARARGADSERRSGACNEHERGGQAANGAGERAGKVYERGGESGQPEPKKKKTVFIRDMVWRKGASVAAMLQRREPIEAKSLRG